MKLGVNDALQTKSPEEWAAELTKAGVKATCFPVDYKTDIQTIDAYARAAKDSGIYIAEVGAWSNPMAKDSKERAAALEKCIEGMKLADYLEAGCCCNVSGSAGEVWDGFYMENYAPDFYKRMVETHQEILRKADPKKSVYTVEPMPFMVPSSPDELLKFLEDIDDPRMAVHLDMVNWMNSFDRVIHQHEFMDEVFEKLHGKIHSVHLKDCKLQHTLTFCVEECLIGTGNFDVGYYLKKIEEENPDLPVLIEHLKRKEDYLYSLDYVRKTFPEYA